MVVKLPRRWQLRLARRTLEVEAVVDIQFLALELLAALASLF
jgi:hypothetical protein